MLRRLRHRLELWFTVKVVIHAIHRLDAKTLGLLLDRWLDTHFGEEDSELVQQEMITWLDTLTITLGQDHGVAS